MFSRLKKVPLPICGVALGFAALGNLLQSYSEGIRLLCGVVSGCLLTLFILKCICHPKTLREDLKNPIMASVLGTFPMALMLLSVYVKPLIGVCAKGIWFLAIGLHILLIVYFTITFIVKLQLSKVFASYYIVYVGIAVASISAPAYGMEALGSLIFWFAFLCLLALVVLVSIRYVRIKDVPNPAKPLICIYAAPMSLCIAGYVQCVMPKSAVFLLLMYAAAAVFYLFALVKAVGYLKLPFFPSYAAFTFPFVISAIASKQCMACLGKLGNPMPILEPIVLVETGIAAAFTVYALIRFLKAMAA